MTSVGLVVAAILMVAALGVVVVGGLTAWGVRRQAQARDAANEVVPGVATRAPASWAGSHDPEARLHRRLRDAVAALRDRATLVTDPHALELRAELEQHALALDDALVDLAKVPAAARDGALARVAAGVEAVERAVGEALGGAAEEATRRLEASLAEVRERRRLSAEAGPVPGDPGAAPGEGPGGRAEPTAG